MLRRGSSCPLATHAATAVDTGPGQKEENTEVGSSKWQMKSRVARRGGGRGEVKGPTAVELLSRVWRLLFVPLLSYKRCSVKV